MDEMLREYIDGLFAFAPKTRKTIELREEMFQNTREKCLDLIKEGRDEEDAYNIAISGIGDVRELIRELQREEQIPDMEFMYNDRQRSAALMALAVVIYIISLVPVILGVVYSLSPGISLLSFLILIAVASGILIYGWQMRPKYTKADDSIVEEFKEFSVDRRNNVKLRLSMSFALWSIIVTIYLAISMLTWRWNITWMIFPVGMALEALITIYFTLRK